ncbi:MAG TPA: hypothetical protein VF251_10295 [Pyrinomonadaceae bacterium]
MRLCAKSEDTTRFSGVECQLRPTRILCEDKDTTAEAGGVAANMA